MSEEPIKRKYIIDADLYDDRIKELEKETYNPEYNTSMKYAILLMKSELEYMRLYAEEEIITSSPLSK